MNKRLLGVIAFAFVVAAVATFLLYQVISRQLSQAAAPSETRLLVAARDLGVGDLIQEIDVTEADWTGAVPESAITNREEIVGRGVIANMYRGEPFLEGRLAPKGAGAGLAATIPVGMRAVAIRVNDVVGVAGFVTPGMRVDVLIMGTPPTGSRELGTQSKTLLQNVEVLSAGQTLERDAEGKPVQVPVVNLLVTPEDAEKLSLASNNARIQLVLRNPLDTEEAKTKGTALQKLFTGDQTPVAPPSPVRRSGPATAPPPRTAAAAKAPPPPVLVEVIHGTKRDTSEFEPKPGTPDSEVEKRR